MIRLKRGLAIWLSTCLIGGMMPLPASAEESVSGNAIQTENALQTVEKQEGENAQTVSHTMTVTGFTALDESVMNQTLPIGASEADIIFPDTLTVTMQEYNGADSADNEAAKVPLDADGTDTTESAAISTELTGITWKLDEAESDAGEFDASEAANGFSYVYAPVLPDTDSNGNPLTLGDTVELPAIYVLVGEYGIAALAEDDAVIEVDGTPYTSFDAWIDWASRGDKDNCNITLLQDAELTKVLHLYGDITLDLNGKTLTGKFADNYNVDYLLVAENADKTWTACNLKITSSISGGKIVMDNPKIKEMLLVKSNASCTIESGVTIEDNSPYSICNLGTLIIQDGVTLHNTNASNEVLRNTGSNATATLEGGIFNGKIMVKDGGTLTISGGAYNDNIQGDGNGKLVISGGTFTNITLSNGQTLQECMEKGHTLKAQDQTTTIDMAASTLSVPAEVVSAKVDFIKQPTLEEEKALLLEGYAAEETAILTATAVSYGTDTPKYQWHVRKTPVGGSTTDETISGATESSYRIPAGLTAGTYEYYCEASADGGTVQSRAVILTVTAGFVQTQIGGTKKNYISLEAACQDITDAVTKDKGSAITLTFLENITENFGAWTLDGTGKTVKLTIDLNRKKVTCGDFTFQHVIAELKNSDSETAGEFNAALNMRDQAVLTAENVSLKKVSLQSGATGDLKDTTTTYVEIGSELGLDPTSNDGIACKIDGGTHKSLKVYAGAELNVTGAAVITDTLQAVHLYRTIPVRAKVTLSGGDYARIQVPTLNVESEESDKGYAIADMLAEGYAFYSLGRKVTIDRSETAHVNLSVCKDDTQEDTDKAVVKLAVTKKDSTENTFYFPGWEEAISFLQSPADAEDWKTVELVLLKDTDISQNVPQIQSGKLSSDLKITIRSQNDGTPCTLHAGNKRVMDLWGFHDVSLQNIKIDSGFIRLYNSTMILENQAEISSNNVGAIWNIASTLIVKDATVKSEGNESISLDAGELRLENENSILSVDKGRSQVLYSNYNNVKSSIIVGETAVMPTVIGNGVNEELDIFCNNPGEKAPQNTDEQIGRVKIWYPITTSESGDELLEGNPTTVSKRDGIIYGLGWASDTSVDRTIIVADTICSYRDPQGSPTPVTDGKFTMPAAPVTLLEHNLDSAGKCANCGKTDLAVAYLAGKLQINGLTGRTFDSQPQILTGIILTGADDSTTNLQGPVYNSGKELAQDATKTENADLTSADYAVVYANNINAYDKKPGDIGFDAAKAPKATIIGHGNYIGSIEYYFTIGQGKLQMFNFYAPEYDSSKVYSGFPQKALHYGIVGYVLDETDKNSQARIRKETPDKDHAFAWVSTGKTLENAGYDSVAAPMIEYSTDNGSTWTEIAENNQEQSKANYWIQEAGTYDFQVRVTAGENAVPAGMSLTTTIQPKDIADSSVTLDKSRPVTAYYTGKPIVPAVRDTLISDTLIKDSNNADYVLQKDKDFTVSATDNTAVTDKATLTFTGTGNYTGTRTGTFSIVYAFELGQTQASKDHWYNTEVPAVFGVDDTTGDAADAIGRIVYRSAAKADTAYDTELSGDVRLYATLEDAVDGTKDNYTFTDEGKQTVALYGRDAAKGYIASPVNVTVRIDKTAPVWADKAGNTAGYGIQIKSNWWRTFINKVSFGSFYKDATLDMKIHASDEKEGVNEVSGIDKYYYYVDRITNAAEGMAAKTKAELDALAAQGAFRETAPASGLFGGEGATVSGVLSGEGNYVLYAYAVDRAGNKSEYICTNGVILDTTAPVISEVKLPTKEEKTLTDTTAAITFTANESGNYYYMLHELTDGADTNAPKSMSDFATKNTAEADAAIDTWTAREGVVTLPMTADAGNRMQLTGLKAKTGYVLYLAATDEAGNASVAEGAGTGGENSGIVSVSFTTTKTIPYVKTAPVLSGTYGDKFSELMWNIDCTVAASPDSMEQVHGTWSIAAEDLDKIPTVGTNEKYTLTFTPAGKDADIYDSVTCEVIPVISKKPVTVVIADKEKLYGDEIPELTWKLVTGDTHNALVTGDTEAALGIRLSTDAKDNSNVGTYAITGTSDSADYEVSFTGSSTDGNCGVLTVKQAANEFKAALTCAGYTYAKDKTPAPEAAAKFGTMTYKYAIAGADGTAPSEETAYRDTLPVNAGTYAVKAYVAETENYAGLVSDPVVFTIAKAAKAPDMPGTTMAPAHSTEKVSDIILPDDWSWSETDRDTALTDGVAVTATAVYTGTDKGNYETESVSITITRSECEHRNTEIRNQKEAACTQTGYTGDTYCADCGMLLGTGKELAATGHDYKASITKQPTTTEEGIRTYTCSRCNSSYTESIAKLPEEQHTHNYTGNITKEATCTEAGIRTYTCSCGDRYTESIPATGHSYVSKVTRAATTAEEGIMTYTCSKCGHSYTQPIAKIKEDDSNKDSSRENNDENQNPKPDTTTGTDNRNTNPEQNKPGTGKENENGMTGSTEQGKADTEARPYLRDDSGKEGWDVIRSQLDVAKSGETVTVAMNGTTVVPKAVIDNIKGEDVTLVLDMGDGISWKINGQEITEAAGDIDFGVTMGTTAGKAIPVEVINNVTGERSYMNLTLAYDGTFGFTATLIVNMESENAGMYANLFYYNEQSGQLEFVSAGQIAADGNVELSFTHASDYTIVIDTAIMDAGNEEAVTSMESTEAAEDGAIPVSDPENTKTYAWTPTIMIIIGICILLIVFGAVILVRKKSGSEEE